MSRAVWSTASASSYVACARESEAAAWTFWPTDDDAQQHQLEEGLADPRHEGHGIPGLDGVGQRHQRQRGERVRAPHRADAVGDLDREGGVQRATPEAVGGGTAASATFGGPAALRATMCGWGMNL